MSLPLLVVLISFATALVLVSKAFDRIHRRIDVLAERIGPDTTEPRQRSTPALRRYVLFAFQAGPRFDKILTQDEIQVLLAQTKTFPQVSIEVWNTHTVLETSYAVAGVPRLERQIAFDAGPSNNFTLWEALIGHDSEWPMLSPRLALEFHARDNRLTFGPILGRFDSDMELAPTSEFRFVDVSLSQLDRFRCPPGPDGTLALDWAEYFYECESGSQDAPVAWSATVRETEKYHAWSQQLADDAYTE